MMEGSRQFYEVRGARLTLPGNSAEESKTASRRRCSTIGREIVTDLKQVLTRFAENGLEHSVTAVHVRDCLKI